MKASPESQRRLLELAEVDAELTRLEHRRRSLPEHEEISTLEQRNRELRDELAVLEARAGDLRREQAKAEADVEQVRARIDRDRVRLDAGQVSSPRELENLQSEVESLHRRQSDLEEIVLDVMERQETAQGQQEAAVAERASIGTSLATVTARRDAALAEIGEQAGKAADRRTAVVADEPADLIDLYERLRASNGG
ncbi:MAG: zinc ribbon domain-containing protein, partial [Streptosporangiaceae bacterium]